MDIEELLDFADKNKDNPLVRTAYLTKAVILADNQKKYVLVIKIVNGLPKKELAQDAEFWEGMGYDASGNLAYVKYQDNDLQGSIKTLEELPASYRSFAQMGFVLQFSPEDNSSYVFRIEVLNDARKGFIKSEKHFAPKMSYWFELVKLYSKNQLQTEASDVFREIIKAFNNVRFQQSCASARLRQGSVTSRHPKPMP